MKKQITYNDLWLFEADVDTVKQTSPALYLINESKFLAVLFGSKNVMHRKALHSRMKETQKKYIAHNDADEPVKLPAPDGGEARWQFLKSMVGPKAELLTGEAIEAAYLAEAGKFLKQSITIEF